MNLIDLHLLIYAVNRDAPHYDEARRTFIAPPGTAGNVTTDAHVAAFAIEGGATLCSTDIDFTRFQMLQWMNPLTPGEESFRSRD